MKLYRLSGALPGHNAPVSTEDLDKRIADLKSVLTNNCGIVFDNFKGKGRKFLFVPQRVHLPQSHTSVSSVRYLDLDTILSDLQWCARTHILSNSISALIENAVYGATTPFHRLQEMARLLYAHERGQTTQSSPKITAAALQKFLEEAIDGKLLRQLIRYLRKLIVSIIRRMFVRTFIDLRQIYRNIIRFLFKNMDDCNSDNNALTPGPYPRQSLLNLNSIIYGQSHGSQYTAGAH